MRPVWGDGALDVCPIPPLVVSPSCVVSTGLIVSMSLAGLSLGGLRSRRARLRFTRRYEDYARTGAVVNSLLSRRAWRAAWSLRSRAAWISRCRPWSMSRGVT